MSYPRTWLRVAVFVVCVLALAILIAGTLRYRVEVAGESKMGQAVNREGAHMLTPKEAQAALAALVTSQHFLAEPGTAFPWLRKALIEDNQTNPLLEEDVTPDARGICHIGPWTCKLQDMTFLVMLDNTSGD